MAIELQINNWYVGYGDALHSRNTSANADTTYMQGYNAGQTERDALSLAESTADISFV